MISSAKESSNCLPLPLLPQDAVATSAHLEQVSAVRQLTRDFQQLKPRHPKRPQLLPVEADSPTKRSVQTGVYNRNSPSIAML